MSKLRTPLLFAIAGTAALAGGVAWFVSLSPPERAEADARVDEAAEVPSRTELARLQQTPQAKAYARQHALAHEVRAFLRDAPRMGAVRRDERADALLRTIDDELAATRMSAGEAFVLQASLVSASVEDEPERALRLAQLAARHRAYAAQREAAHAAGLASDPRFRDYKAREAAIVAEVAALAVIPDGLGRDEYLRRRLQQAREEAYR
jgi:hypothetical protein